MNIQVNDPKLARKYEKIATVLILFLLVVVMTFVGLSPV